jgi:hypothetical protein
MSNWFMLIALSLLQCFAGLGLISLFRVWLKPAMMIALWMLTGVAIFSLIPFLLQLFYIPLTGTNIFLALIITSLLLNLKYKQSLYYLKKVWKQRSFHIRLYEIPFLIVIIAMALISVWRCYYLPPTPRDLTSGPEVIAEYTVREKTMINSVFSINLESTNNQFKPPFIASLQIIYKYAGFAFGQLWLSTIFISFLVFLYHATSKTLHRILSGLLLVAFIAIPEMYGYTFMALFDYSNAVFFFLSAYFVVGYFKTHEKNLLQLAGLLMAIATYIRSETLILAGIMAVAIIWHHARKWNGLGKLLLSLATFLLPAFILYILSITIYINYYLPVAYNVEGQLNPDLLNVKSLVTKFITTNERLIFSGQGIMYYGYFIFIFLLVLLIDLVLFRKLNRAARNWLFAVLVIYLGFPLLGHILPLMDIDHTTKRGFLKLFPLMLLYMANSSALLWLSEKIKNWEIAR